MIWKIKKTFHSTNKDIQRRLSGHINEYFEVGKEPMRFHSKSEAVNWLLGKGMEFRKINRWHIYSMPGSTITYTINRTRRKYVTSS